MAQANFTPIQLYSSTTLAAVPLSGNLATGELALNIADGKLYFKNASNAVTLLASTGGASGNVVGPASATDGNLAAFDGTTGKLIKQAAAVTIAQGGTGQTTQQAAINALVGTQAANRVLRSNGTNSVLAQVALSTDVTGTLAVANGGTGLTTYTVNGVLYASAAGTLANGTALTFDGEYLNVVGSANIGSDSNNALFVNSTSTVVTLTAAGRSAPVDSSLSFATTASGVTASRAILDPLGNFKLGNTAPANWSSFYQALQVGNSAAMYSVTGNSYFLNNAYIAEGLFADVPTYLSTNPASYYAQNASGHIFYTAPSGTNGTEITFTERARLDISGTFRVKGAGVAGSADAVQFNGSAPANSLVLNAAGNLSVPGIITSTLSGTASTATNIAGGAANQIPRQSGAGVTTFIAAPTTASTFLTWDGSAFTWSNVAPGSTFATDISVNTLTVGKGPNSPVGTTTFGFQAGAAATANNVKQTAIGYRALATSTVTAGSGFDWDGSTAVGYQALELSNPSILSYNTAIGSGALKLLTTGGANTAVGAGAARQMTIGTGAVAVGALAAQSAINGGFVAVGYQAANSGTTQISATVAVGQESLFFATTNSSNSAIFNRRNTAVGHQTLYNLDAESTATAGSENTSLGYLAGRSLLSGGNNLILGNNAQASTTSVSNEITLGNSSVTTLRCQVTSITSLSDQRDKHSIEDLPVGLALINALRPRRYKWDKRDWYINEVEQEDGTTDYVPVPQDGSRAQDDWNEGFVAQEAKAALQSLGASWFPLVYETNPEKLEMSSGKLIPVLVKAIQELTARLEALEAK